MTSARYQFIRNKEDLANAKAILLSDFFTKLLIHARAEMATKAISSQELAGARKFEEVLLSFATEIEPMPTIDGPGLKHDIVIPVKRWENKEPEQPAE